MLGETLNNYKGKGSLQRFPWGKYHCLPTQTQENRMEAKKLKSSTMHIEGKKVAILQSHLYVPLKVVGPINKYLLS